MHYYRVIYNTTTSVVEAAEVGNYDLVKKRILSDRNQLYVTNSVVCIAFTCVKYINNFVGILCTARR